MLCQSPAASSRLRDERDQDVLARRLASDVSLMDVLSHCYSSA